MTKSALRRSSLRVALTAGLCLLASAGCRSKVDEMSEYPFFIRGMDERWEITRDSLKSETPNVSFCMILLQDLRDAANTMEVTYFKANRDEAIGGLRELAKTFRADLDPLINLDREPITLRSGATNQQVAEAVETAYRQYLEVRKLIQM